MAEKYELDRWAAVVCNGFTAVNVMSSGNVEELGWDYTEMELDPTGTCGLFDGMLLDWDDDTPAERRDHEAYFPDAFTVGARILADDWDHELGNDEVRSRCFAIIEDADQFTDHDTARDWLCESTMADFSEVEARTFFQNLTLMDSEEIAKLDGRPIIPSAGADECRAAVLAFNERMVPRRRELGLGDTAVVGKTKKSEATSKVVPMKKEQTVHGLGRVDFSGLGYGWGTNYPDSLSVDAIGINPPSGERYVILNFSHHIMVNPADGSLVFYYSPEYGWVGTFDSFPKLLEHVKDSEQLHIDMNPLYALQAGDTPTRCDVALERYDAGVLAPSPSMALAPASIEGVEVLEKSEGRDLDRLVNVDLEHGAYKLSRDVAPLQRLFSKHVLRNFDARLAELDDGSAARRTKSMAGRVFKDEFGMMWLIVGDDLGEFVDALDQDGKERRVTVLALRKLVATQGDGRWLTKSLDETESAFKGRYQPKAWRGALPSLRLRDLSAGE